MTSSGEGAMRNLRTRNTVIALLLLGTLACRSTAESQSGADRSSQTGAASNSNGLPRTSWDGKPDLSGVWGGPLPADGTSTAPERQKAGAALKALYQPWALERTNSLKYTEDPRLHCAPYGFPRYMSIVALTAPRKSFYFLFQIVQAPKQMAVLIEYMSSSFRVIHTDGSVHPAKMTPTYFGDSRARWEGDTLVVDATGFNGRTWLAGSLLTTGNVTAGMGDGGTMTSDALHVIERWRLVDKDTLEYEATVEDPKVLTGAWTPPRYRVRRAAPGTIINEALCVAPEDLRVIRAAQEAKK
jgi:hypothetical protein